MSSDLHRRLKLISVETRLPLTDIMNQATREWVERYDAGVVELSPKDRLEPSVPARITSLRSAKRNGDFYSEVSGMSKALLVDIAKCLSLDADNRMSRDSAVSAIYNALQ